MRRIIMMVLRLFFKVPFYLYQITRYGKQENENLEEAFATVKRATIAANHAGRVTIEAHGLENLPEEDGFVFFPNHQGLFDVLVFLESCPVPFSFVIKKEARNIILLKQVVDALHSISIDREDIRQSMQVINEVAEEVEKGRNFLIFAEGTRSRKGNKLLEFKAGTFKCAVKSKCPIVPCALIDSFKPFDEKSVKPVTVKLIYLPPLYYEEYGGMRTKQIAAEVKARIEAAIAQYENT